MKQKLSLLAALAVLLVFFQYCNSSKKATENKKMMNRERRTEN